MWLAWKPGSRRRPGGMQNGNPLAQSETRQEKLRRLEDERWEAKRKVALLTLELWVLRQGLEATP